MRPLLTLSDKIRKGKNNQQKSKILHKTIEVKTKISINYGHHSDFTIMPQKQSIKKINEEEYVTRQKYIKIDKLKNSFIFLEFLY